MSQFAPKELRVKCPCATCVDEWSGEVRVQAGNISDDIRAQDVARVGNYALSFTWSDGHTTGIYTFERLRAMCRCEACREG